METSLLDLDVYVKILEYADWTTLQQLKSVNSFLYPLAIKEIKKRLISKYPFGEPQAKLSVIVEDINLETIFCQLDGKTIYIPKEKHNSIWVRNLLKSWFKYSFYKKQYTLSTQLFQSIFRIFNRNLRKIDEHRQTLIFSFLRGGEVILDDIF